ncbi:helix-turn-helix domain-containing protein [Azoarcus taiwanensis]|uniref:Helix-turn-helix domain-containing protein n=1 Tax=Azoarcus taiwanensis TaxID=666964 RepID=A0A972F878_9RHOO|nr:helix-turn-helix domain-containing protein [Azoarcus taiwanensis]NMG03793.1 helix-turn-helix domain-containing protein [Azoarcus taiwanensis]
MQVQKLRLQRGWSQQQLAELSGLSTRTIQRIENGQTPSTESLKSLTSVFEIDFSSLAQEHDMQASTSSVSKDEQLALAQVRRLRRFHLQLALYVVVITGLAIVNLTGSSEHWWFIWPALGWGLALLIQAASAFEFAPFFGARWERKQVEKRLGRRL